MHVRKLRRADEPALTYGRTGAWGGFSASEVRATPGRYAGTVPGEHRVLIFVTAGVEADCRCEGVGGFRTTTPYEFDVVPAGAFGEWEDRSACDMLVLRFAPKLFQSATEALDGKDRCAPLAPQLGARDEHVKRLVQVLMAEMRSSMPAGRLFVDSLSVALAARLLQLSPGSAALPALSKARLRRVHDFIETHLAEDLRLDGIAESAGISVAHLTVLFKRATGQTVHSFVMERRVLRAQALLLGGTSITRAAHEAGFAHASHLARWMQRVLGAKPSEFATATNLMREVDAAAN